MVKSVKQNLQLPQVSQGPLRPDQGYKRILPPLPAGGLRPALPRAAGLLATRQGLPADRASVAGFYQLARHLRTFGLWELFPPHKSTEPQNPIDVAGLRVVKMFELRFTT